MAKSLPFRPVERIGQGSVVHMLSFDVEEYFQVEGVRIAWERGETFPRRVVAAVERILEVLAEGGASATFFVLGCVGESEPDLIRRIADAGHEIASHGMTHTMLTQLSRDQFRRDLLASRALLEDLTGRKVVGYRAPTFSITARTTWALDVLAEAGFCYDSSVFPIRHDRYGIPQAPGKPHWAVGPEGGCILEIPPLTVRVLGMNFPVGGGGYLRLLPRQVTAGALKHVQRKGRSAMLYLHPWELDADQPVLPMSLLERFRHRVGLGRTEGRLKFLLRNFAFSSVEKQLPVLKETAHQRYTYAGIV